MVVGDSVDIFDTGDIFDTDVDKIDIVTTFNLNFEKVDIVEAISKTQLSIKNARQKCELYYIFRKTTLLIRQRKLHGLYQTVMLCG